MKQQLSGWFDNVELHFHLLMEAGKPRIYNMVYKAGTEDEKNVLVQCSGSGSWEFCNANQVPVALLYLQPQIDQFLKNAER